TIPATVSAHADGDTDYPSEGVRSDAAADLQQTHLLASAARGFAFGPAPPAAAPPVPGLPQLEGYEGLHLLGRGGTGVVYKARQVALDRVVALKMIRADLGIGAEERARFRTEAEAAARLQHPNIVQVYEVGGLEGVPYIALEFVGGGSLADHLNGTPLP